MRAYFHTLLGKILTNISANNFAFPRVMKDHYRQNKLYRTSMIMCYYGSRRPNSLSDGLNVTADQAALQKDRHDHQRSRVVIPRSILHRCNSGRRTAGRWPSHLPSLRSYELKAILAWQSRTVMHVEMNIGRCRSQVRENGRRSANELSGGFRVSRLRPFGVGTIVSPRTGRLDGVARVTSRPRLTRWSWTIPSGYRQRNPADPRVTLRSTIL